MKNMTSALLLIALAACGALRAQTDGPTPYPNTGDESAWPGRGPVRNHDWMAGNRAYFWTRRAQDRGAVVFAGDSITGNWKTPVLAAAFPKLKTANRGIGGDVTRGLLFRFKEDVLDLNPRALVLCIGTNDLSAHSEPAVIAQNIALLLDQARAANPAMPVVLCTVPPRANPKSPLKRADALTDLNARIVRLAEGREHVVVFDLFAALATPAGTPAAEYFREDLIHPSPAGYRQWGERLTPVLESVATGAVSAATQ